MREPTTETGKRLHQTLCGFSMPHGCGHLDGICDIEDEAKAQELERLLGLVCGPDCMEHEGEHYRIGVDILWPERLADPEPSE